MHVNKYINIIKNTKYVRKWFIIHNTTPQCHLPRDIMTRYKEKEKYPAQLSLTELNLIILLLSLIHNKKIYV